MGPLRPKHTGASSVILKCLRIVPMRDIEVTSPVSRIRNISKLSHSGATVKMAPHTRLSQLNNHLAHKSLSVTAQNLSQADETSEATASRVLYGTHEFSPGVIVGTITVSNPEKLNIVNTKLLDQVVDACIALTDMPSLRAVVLTGATSPSKAASFIGGADISEMSSLQSPDAARTFITKIHMACRALRGLSVPVIARVNGFALGAGLEIMAACDLRICTSSSVFGMPEVKIGIPSVIEAALLPGLIGWGRTRRLLYLAENFDAAEAERWGLIECVVSDEKELDAVVNDWVEKLAITGPRAIKSQKKLINKWENSSLEQAIQAGIDAFAEAFEQGGPEPKKMMAKFMNRKR